MSNFEVETVGYINLMLPERGYNYKHKETPTERERPKNK